MLKKNSDFSVLIQLKKRGPGQHFMNQTNTSNSPGHSLGSHPSCPHSVIPTIPQRKLGGHRVIVITVMDCSQTFQKH
jgi:hypothetical protein